MSLSQNQRPRFLVFDSGLGGLSIVAELSAAGLAADVYYVADTAYFPYGEKSDDVLMARIPHIISKAAAQCRADLVIVACNTASTLALDAVRAAVPTPVIGVVPAIKPAAALTKSRTIGLLATPNTVARPYTDKLIADFASGVTVLRHGAVGLAATAELALCGGRVDLDVVQSSVDGLFSQDGGDSIDVVVLACTHYPHLKHELINAAPREVLWVDSGAAIAARAQALLALSGGATTNLVTAFTTGGNQTATQWGLENWGFGHVETLPA